MTLYRGTGLKMGMEDHLERPTLMSPRTRGPSAIILAVIILAVVVAAVFAVIIRSSRASRSPIGGPSSSTPQTESVLVAIEGMSCTGCSSGIQAMLKHTPGVISADVSLERKEANVEFDPSLITREKIVEAINNMGYRGSIKG